MKLLLILSICSASFYSKATENLTAEQAEKYALYAMMSSNAYHDDDRTYFPIEELGWRRILNEQKQKNENTYSPKFLGKIFSNLQYDIWEDENSNITVFAFKGTSEKIDWVTNLLAFPVAVQYKSAKKRVKSYISTNQNRKIILTGHSLGGGIAISVSLWLGETAIVFNSSPRVFDGFKDKREPAERIAIYQAEELLQKFRKMYFKFNNLVNLDDKTRNIDVIKTNFTYDRSQNKHSADLLAEGILRCATNNPDYVKLASELKTTKIKCNF